MTMRNATPLFAGTLLAAALAAADPVSVYTHLVDPRGNPDDARRHVKPPSWETFGNRPHFMALRKLAPYGYKAQLDRVVDQDRLGDVIWAHASMLGNANLAEQVAELKRRGCFLFDLWGYHPGVGHPPGRPFEGGEFIVPPETCRLFERELGDHWLGMDCGEQDGRYVSPIYGYARQKEPLSADPIDQYLDFQRWFEHLHRNSGNRMAALISLTYGHYLARECCYTMMGAETAQSLPNAQIYYSFLRGSGKQYGVPWFGNASVFNRWGWKGYPVKPSSNPRGARPTGGTSLALLKKLMYAQLLYNCSVLGFECWHYETRDGKGVLSPIGRIQRGAVDWCARYGTPGVMHTPVAIMFDFFSGWTYPRHHYGKEEVFKNWGAVPWNEGDFFAAGVLEMLYPEYAEAGFWRDERGFNSDTPYGDIADCVLSDAPAWMLAQYPVLVLGTKMRPSAELADTLTAYVRGGGHLVLTRGNRRALFPQGVPSAAPGRITEIPSEWGVAERPVCALPVASEVEKPFPSPFPLLPEARRILADAFRAQMIFGTSPQPVRDGLALVTARRGRGEYTVAVLNNTWQPRPLQIHAYAGRLLSVTELPTPDDAKGDVGYMPEMFTNLTAGADTPQQIAAGSVRLFRVKTDEGAAVRELPPVRPVPNAAGRVLPLRNVAGPFKEAVLVRPTFFRHWDAVMLDWRYLAARTMEDLREQTNWMRLQGLRVAVDLRSGLNHYPDLRFTDNMPEERVRTDRALDDVLAKMEILGAKDLLVTPVRYDWYIKDYGRQMREGLTRLAQKAAAKGVTLHVAVSWWRGRYQGMSDYAGTARLVRQLAQPNVKVAPSVADQLHFHGGDAAKVAAEIAAADCGMVLASAPETDAFGHFVSRVKPLAMLPPAQRAPIVEALSRKRGVQIVFDAVYPDADAEYIDQKLLTPCP